MPASTPKSSREKPEALIFDLLSMVLNARRDEYFEALISGRPCKIQPVQPENPILGDDEKQTRFVNRSHGVHPAYT
jgi:hypothetical protein